MTLASHSKTVAETPSEFISEGVPLPFFSKKTVKGGIVIQRPGITSGSWERWLIIPDQEPGLLSTEAALPTGSEQIVALPSSLLYAWPLWIATDGDVAKMVRLELSGRHLLKKGMEDSLSILPILKHQDRQLLLAIANEEPFPSEVMPEAWKSAARYELPSRLLRGSLTRDLILWEEWSKLQVAFYRDQKPVWFGSVRPSELSGVLYRIALRLLVENVLDHFPQQIAMERISPALAKQCLAGLENAFPQASINTVLSDENISPILPKVEVDLPPREAREARLGFKNREKLLSFAMVAAILYLLLLLWGGGDLWIRQSALQKLRQEISKVETPALEAQKASARWHALRPAIDPNTFALDLLAAVSKPTEGGKVRLTLFSLEQGHLHISGEATDVTQAYSFIEVLKKNPLLQEYDWTASQPQIAGKNSVKFDIEGIHLDAPHETK